VDEWFSTDYKKAVEERVNEILIKSRVITSFPFKCPTLIKELGKEIAIELFPFSWIEEHGMKAEEVVLSEDADTVELCGRYIIFYNQAMPSARLTFSEAHELGHIVLAHDIETITNFRKTKDSRLKPLYERYEAEANYFAACLLMPEAVINRLKALGCRITVDFLQSNFGVSEEAAQIRISTLRRNSQRHVLYWEKDKSLDNAVLLKFKDFIQKVAPRRRSYEEEYAYEEEMEAERNRWLAEGY
jgi:Zn-dependent peptidase ImmA (M78 family)